VPTKQSAPPFSLREWLHSTEKGASYAHPDLGAISSRGHQINIRTAEVNSGALLAGGRLISIRDMLRPPLLLQAAGALVLEDLQNGADTIGSLDNLFAGWLIDQEEVPSSDVSTGTAVVGNAITTARVDVSRRLKIQSPGAEATLRASMQAAMRVSIEQAILAGTGTLGQPPGLIGEQAIPSESGAATVATLLEDVQAVVDAGAPVENVSIIASAADFAELMGDASNPAVRHQNATPTTGAVHNLVGIGLRFTPHLSTGQALTGDFSRLTVAYYGLPELLANPYIYAASGGLRLQAWQHAGAVVDQTAAFVRRVG
jgi:HK97 family phage major capsid protein